MAGNHRAEPVRESDGERVGARAVLGAVVTQQRAPLISEYEVHRTSRDGRGVPVGRGVCCPSPAATQGQTKACPRTISQKRRQGSQVPDRLHACAACPCGPSSL